MKFDLHRVVDGEVDTISEWYSITDKVFRFVGWLLILSAVYAIYDKTKNIIFYCVWLILCFFIGKLISKIALFRINFKHDNESKSGKILSKTGYYLSLIINISITFLVIVATQYIVHIFASAKIG